MHAMHDHPSGQTRSSTFAASEWLHHQELGSVWSPRVVTLKRTKKRSLTLLSFKIKELNAWQSILVVSRHNPCMLDYSSTEISAGRATIKMMSDPEIICAPEG